jgi:hypothetical protein
MSGGRMSGRSAGGADDGRGTWEDGRTILGRRDFVVIVRRWRQQGPVRRPGAWTPAAVVDDQRLAEAIVLLLQEAETRIEVRAVSAHELLHKFRDLDRDRILDCLNNRTTADIDSDRALRCAAEARLLGSTRENRSGIERRSGLERRAHPDRYRAGSERRAGIDRRSGRDRRRLHAAG